jgi:hypothetical protein
MNLPEIIGGSNGVLFQMALIGVSMPLVIGSAKLYRHLRRHQRLRTVVPTDPLTASPTFRRYLLAAAATSTQHGWDHHVRPVLAELARPRFADPHSSEAVTYGFARQALGDELFRLVDPSVNTCRDRTVRGPGPGTLARILEVLEAAGLGSGATEGRR